MRAEPSHRVAVATSSIVGFIVGDRGQNETITYSSWPAERPVVATEAAPDK
jgi:hypothetical protein